MTTTDATRYASAREVLETSDDAVARSESIDDLVADSLVLEDGLLLLALRDSASIVVTSALEWIVDQCGVGLSEKAAERVRELCRSTDELSKLYAIWAAGRIGLGGVEPILRDLWSEAGEDEVALRAAIAEACQASVKLTPSRR